MSWKIHALFYTIIRKVPILHNFKLLSKKKKVCSSLYPKLTTKHLSHIHGLHPGSSRILIRDHPACNAKILSQCRCEYVANWALIRISTVSIRIDKAATPATRTSPERPRSEPGLYTDEHGSNWAFTRSVYGRARSLLGYPRSVDGVLTKGGTN